MKDLLKSKKFRTMVLGFITTAAIKVAALKGIVLDAATADYLANSVLGLASAYILSQGLADFGKEGKLQALLQGAKDVAASVSADDALEDTADEIEAEASGEAPAEDAPKSE